MCGECFLVHALWKETHGRTNHHDVGGIDLNIKLIPVTFLNIDPGARYRDIQKVLKAPVVPFFAYHPNYSFQYDNAYPILK